MWLVLVNTALEDHYLTSSPARPEDERHAHALNIEEACDSYIHHALSLQKPLSAMPSLGQIPQRAISVHILRHQRIIRQRTCSFSSQKVWFLDPAANLRGHFAPSTRPLNQMFTLIVYPKSVRFLMMIQEVSIKRSRSR